MDEDPTGVGFTPHQPQFAEQGASWGELLGLFLKLGVVAFGGPVAHIAIMEREVVKRRKWVSRQHFLDLMAATNLLPGPNSTQMVMHIGYVQRGDLGVWAAGSAFILTATAVTLGVSWAYVAYRELPTVDALFYGIQPVVVAIIAAAMWRLAPQAADEPRTVGVFVVSMALALIGVNELLVLALGGLAGAVMFHLRPWRWLAPGGPLLLTPWIPVWPATGRPPEATTEALLQLAWLFFKFGITLFGSGYLLIAYLRGDLVDRLGLLTIEQLVEAVVIGEMTPGPLFTTSTAVGYILGGFPGAAVATVAIFLPSFFLAMMLGRWMTAIKRSQLASATLRGLTAAVLGVMLAVTILIGIRVIVDPFTAVLAAAALLALIRFQISAIALIPVGAVLGFAGSLLS